MRIDRHGSVMVHVLMTGVLVAIIAAGLMRMTMLRYMATARVTSGTISRREADSALNRALSYWNSANMVCFNNIPGYNCTPLWATTSGPGTCNCTCTPTDAGDATIVVSGGGPPPCDISIQSVDPP